MRITTKGVVGNVFSAGGIVIAAVMFWFSVWQAVNGQEFLGMPGWGWGLIAAGLMVAVCATAMLMLQSKTNAALATMEAKTKADLAKMETEMKALIAAKDQVIAERDARITELHQGRPVVKEENREAERVLGGALIQNENEMRSLDMETNPQSAYDHLVSIQDMVATSMRTLARHWKMHPPLWSDVKADPVQEWAALTHVINERYRGRVRDYWHFFQQQPDGKWRIPKERYDQARNNSVDVVALLIREVRYPKEFDPLPDSPTVWTDGLDRFRPEPSPGASGGGVLPASESPREGPA